MILGKSSLWMPMGTVICYGTLITMLFILTVLPCLYLLTFRGSTERRAKWDALEQQQYGWGAYPYAGGGTYP